MKKNLPIILILALCGIAFVAGVAFAGKAMISNGDKEAAIKKNEKTLNTLLNRKKGALALSEENLEQGNASLSALKDAARKRVGILLQPKRLETFFKGDATQFMASMTRRNSDWIRYCEEGSVELAPAVRGFGFSRYLVDNETVPAAALECLDTEAAIVGSLIESLINARAENEKDLRAANVLSATDTTYLKLVSIARESFELLPEQQRSLKRDEIVVTPSIDAGDTGLVKLSDYASKESLVASLRREHSVNALAFRVSFIGDTGVLRKFIRELEAFPIYVRDIEASRATPEMLPAKNTPAPGEPAATVQNPFDVFNMNPGVSSNAQPAAPRVPARRVIVQNIPELFTVTLEYISPKAGNRKENQKSE